MSGYYPEGVTGRELAIAGPDSERSAKREVQCRNEDCGLFEQEQEVDGEEWIYEHSGYFDWTCPECGTEDQEEFDADIEYGPDPDDLLDAYRESLWD